jgi:hypothetical protein
MDPGEQTTGTRDEHYNLISVLYHALEGADTADAYIADAEGADDDQLLAFFREAKETHEDLAEKAKALLGIGGGLTSSDPAITGPALTEPPPERGLHTGTVPPQTAESGWETPPPPPRLASPAQANPPIEEEAEVPTLIPRESPPPGEERPKRRGKTQSTTGSPREDPPPGEQRPGR